MTDRLLTADEVAELLQVKATWVYRASREGLIPTVVLGRYYRYRASTIEGWLADQERAGKAAGA